MNFNQKNIDVIIPTISNLNNLSKLIIQILRQKGSFEVCIFIINQNFKNKELKKIFYNSKIKHIKILKKKLSKAKNIGIDFSKSSLVTFLDDDVLIPNDYFLKCYNFIKKNKVDVLFNKILDNQNKTLTLSMSNNILKINKKNWRCCLASTMWFKKSGLSNIKFDERFGIGGPFGSGEETDYLMRSLRRGKRVFYNGQINIVHPNDNNYLSKKECFEKFKNYGFGQGALLKKFQKEFGKFSLIESTLRSVIAIFYFLFFLKSQKLIQHLALLVGKLKGYRKFIL